MKLTLDQAQEILADKEAIKRRSLTEDVIEIAYKLAENNIGEGFLNEMYWGKIIPEIDRLSGRQYGNACKIADYLVSTKPTERNIPLSLPQIESDEIIKNNEQKEMPADIDVSLISDKEGKPMGFVVKTITKGDRWNGCYGFCKRNGTWIPDKKYWIIKPETLKEAYRKMCIDFLSDAFDGIASFGGVKNIKANFTSQATNYLNEWIELFYPEENEAERE